MPERAVPHLLRPSPRSSRDTTILAGLDRGALHAASQERAPKSAEVLPDRGAQQIMRDGALYGRPDREPASPLLGLTPNWCLSRLTARNRIGLSKGLPRLALWQVSGEHRRLRRLLALPLYGVAGLVGA